MVGNILFIQHFGFRGEREHRNTYLPRKMLSTIAEMSIFYKHSYPDCFLYFPRF